ncbi:hypothetical protein [Kitasatospora sp. NPDC050543]|uniref:hypothetical protein n=1 Tax=Kitasatospora sp. NPDC050543 TaxID=3364054 RepID=UPI00379FAC97
MRQATINFTASLVVNEDGDEWEGDDMSPSDLSSWVAHALARGDKHASGYTAYGAVVTSVEYADVDRED